MGVEVHRIEIAGDRFEETVFRAGADTNLHSFALEICEKFGLDSSRAYMDVEMKDDNVYSEVGEKLFRYFVTGGRDSGICDEAIPASNVRLSHVLENIGDVMVFRAGYDRLVIKLRGIVFD